MSEILPEEIELHAESFGDGAAGYATQVWRNEEHGVQCDAIRRGAGAPFEETWTHDRLPNAMFATYTKLRNYVEVAKTSERFAPKVIDLCSPHAASVGNCWRCRGLWTFTIRVKIGWRDSNIEHIPSCADCVHPIEQDPLATISARRAFVRERLESFGRRLKTSDEDEIPF